jgi:hypothetical protein
MKRKLLPIGRQSFRDLREENCIYVDKTESIYHFCTQGKMYFLSRPRRFGKSLLLSTLEALYSGSKDLFEGTWIEDKWDWTKKYPIIHISFNLVDYEENGLKLAIKRTLIKFYKEYDLVPSEDASIKILLADLLEQLYKKQGQVVLLIDEYDKPIIDYMENNDLEQAKTNQKVLELFYGAVKDSEKFIRLFFITGVSKFTKVSLFSKLNNLIDLTLHPSYSTLLGYTQEEFENNFESYIDEALITFHDYTRQALLTEIKIWYNGYSWDGKKTLYNHFGILLFLNSYDFQSYWFASGTPSFLIKKIEENHFFYFENMEADLNFLDQYSLDNLEITSLLFQTGYLTIKEKSKFGELVLSFPNKEVQLATYTFLIDDMGNTKGGGGVTVRHLYRAFMDNDLNKGMSILISLFSSLAYDVYSHQKVNQIEGFYHGLIHILFKCLGIYMQSEVHTLKGRADGIVETPTHIYILEFKINNNASAALQQIIHQEYALPYLADRRIKIGVGINFDSLTRELNGWETDVLLRNPEIY